MNRYLFLLSLLWQHALSYLVGAVMAGLTIWMTMAVPRYLQEAIDIISAEEHDPSAFMEQIGWILLFALFIICTRTLSRLCFFIPGRKVEYDLKNRLLAHLTTLQRGFFNENPTGGIISRINNDINGIRMLMGFGLMQLIRSLSMLTLAPYYMYQISPWLTLYVALPITLGFVLLQLSLRRLRSFQLEQMQALQKLSDFIVESYGGIDVLKSTRAFPWTQARFGERNQAVQRPTLRMSVVRAFFMPILAHMVTGMKVLLVAVGGMMVIDGEMSMGAFMAYSLYLTMLVPPLMGMTFMMFVLQRGFTALNSLELIFNTRPDLPTPRPASEQALSNPLRQGLELRNLSYAYPDKPEQPVLRDISFRVQPGKILGIFGRIGCGKTTLVNIINRYLEPPPGTVFLDKADITKISQHRLRASVVTVSQEPFLFSDSVRENIGFANVQAPPGALEKAVQSAALVEDLSRFPQGLDTLVGERGITLSGGQKQRMALARSLLKPCDLLILDDVLSAVDHETERHLIEQIYGFQHARSLLIVSHRVSVLEGANQILVLNDGLISAEGDHQSLIGQPGIYREAWLRQREMLQKTQAVPKSDQSS